LDTLLALLALALVARTGGEEAVRTVTQAGYISPSCWFDAQGEFTAFLLYHAGEGRGIAYPISGKCMLDPSQGSMVLATARQIGLVDLIDRHGVLQPFFPDVVLAESTTTDQDIPASISRVYYIRARVTPVRMPGGSVYAPERILQLEVLDITARQFMELTRAERERLWRAHRSRS
jgi:hypothetical protein